MNTPKNNPSMFDSIEKTPDIPHRVAHQVIRHIIDGTLKPGDKLPSEKQMQSNFGISRISLREAMKLLEAKGYIESHGRRGKFVKKDSTASLESAIEDIISVNHEKIWELLTVRRIIDSEAAYMAALHANEKQINQLRQYVKDARQIGIPNLVNTIEGGKLYSRFYSNLAQATNNTIFARIMKSISSLLKGALPYSRMKLTNIEEASEILYTTHLKIFQAIEKRDAATAKAMVIEHIDWLEQSLKSVLE
ncbi:MAG: FadR/GntR family transcriptional regulator [Thermodesulfobacteriota bacterium]|nr:FadR/GntR family transcriptional regulator [Thermodesulfobacteriota bacterium]